MTETQKKITLKMWMFETWFEVSDSFEGFTRFEIFSDAVTSGLTLEECDFETLKPNSNFYDFINELETIKNK